MKIEIHLFATLTKYLPPGVADNTFLMEVDQGTPIKDIINRIGIPQADVKIIFLNGVHARDIDKLKDGDRLGIFPPIGGG